MLRLKELRVAKGLSQQTLANAAGISISLVQKIENDRTNPTETKIRALAGALGVDIGELFAESAA